MRLEELDTPSLIIHMDGLEDNLDRYQHYFREHGIGLRPHIKTHKCLAIAHMQLRRGAIGITCQKLGEAEVMVAGGAGNDVLIPYNIVGRRKLHRLATLARKTRITVAADSTYTVDGLAVAAKEGGAVVGVVVELYKGRTGVLTAAAGVALASHIDRVPGLELRGIMIMPGSPEVRPLIKETLDLFDRAGLPHPIVSGGSTPSAFTAHQVPELTEFRAGEYPTGGLKHLLNKSHTIDQNCLRVLTTVVSRPVADQAVIDAGSKTMSAVVRGDIDPNSMGYIVEYPHAQFRGASEEHGIINVSACSPPPEIGERLQVVPVHPCPCVNEHDEIFAVRHGEIEAKWPVDARGRIR